MSNSFGSVCDDFYCDMYINTELTLPTERETVLAFFNKVQKIYPTMGCFYKREEGDYCLEEDRESNSCRWVILDSNRVISGYINPDDVSDAFSQHEHIIDTVPYMLGINHLDVDSLDLVFSMDFDYKGNHDELISSALLHETPYSALLDINNSRPIGYSPSYIVSLSEDCRTQLKITVESKTSLYEVRKGSFREQAITLAVAFRQYPRPNEKFDTMGAFRNLCSMGQTIMHEKIVPAFVNPIAREISHRRS